MALYRDDHVGEALGRRGRGGDLRPAEELRVAALATLALRALLAGDDEPPRTARAAFEHPDAGERPNGYIGAAVLASGCTRGRARSARSHADRGAGTREATSTAARRTHARSSPTR